ncbi:MAG: hypothetical protein ACYCVB_05435 [Bacilli bacterium]
MDSRPDWQELCRLLDMDPEVADEYGLNPQRMERRGNALRLTTDGATVYIKRMRSGQPDLDAVHQLTERLVRQGVRVPRMLQNKYGDPWVRGETGDFYVLPQIAGQPVRLDDESEFVEVARVLGAWHRHAAAEPGRFAQPLRADLKHWWGLARVKLDSYREYALDRPAATELDESFLAVREDIDRQLARALAYLQHAQYGALCERAQKRGELCHGNVVRQNLIRGRDGVYILDHSHVFEGPQILDLANYIQRYAARFDWDRRLCAEALDAYRRERPLSETEWLALAVLFAYPADVLRILEYYYEQRQDWDEEDFRAAFAQACEWDQARIQFHESAFADTLPPVDESGESDEQRVPSPSWPLASSGSFSRPRDEGDDDDAPVHWGRRPPNTNLPEIAAGPDPAPRVRQGRRTGLWRPPV